MSFVRKKLWNWYLFHLQDFLRSLRPTGRPLATFLLINIMCLQRYVKGTYFEKTRFLLLAKVLKNAYLANDTNLLICIGKILVFIVLRYNTAKFWIASGMLWIVFHQTLYRFTCCLSKTTALPIQSPDIRIQKMDESLSKSIHTMIVSIKNSMPLIGPQTSLSVLHR